MIPLAGLGQRLSRSVVLCGKPAKIRRLLPLSLPSAGPSLSPLAALAGEGWGQGQLLHTTPDIPHSG